MDEAKGSRGGEYSYYRPAKPVGGGFPVYPELVGDLVRGNGDYSARAAHVCAVLSGWAYSDRQTVAQMMVRIGLPNNRCRTIGLFNDTMFICSTAYLVQSACGRVALLAYRGTEPLNLVNWLTDANVSPIMLPLSLRGAPLSAPSRGGFRHHDDDDNVARIHGGFYRNQRATWFDVMKGLKLALEGKSILEGTVDTVGPEPDQPVKMHPLEALYITGHSLGAAMAVIAAFRIARDEGNEVYRELQSKLRGVYSFGQPMIGNHVFSDQCEASELLSTRVYRHVYANDLVPALPPTAAGPFKHFGTEYRSVEPGAHSSKKDFVWEASSSRTAQLKHLVGIVAAASEFGVEQLPSVNWIPSAIRRLPVLRDSGLGYSLHDHSTTYYIDCSQPEDVLSEFGDP